MKVKVLAFLLAFLGGSGWAQVPPGVDINALLQQAQKAQQGAGGARGDQAARDARAKAQALSQAGVKDLISVSADIVEISGSLQTQTGFGWSRSLEFGESAVPFPGIIRVGEFARKTALNATLTLLQSEGKAQLLSNPKVIVKSGEPAHFLVGGEIPFPVINNQGVGVSFKKFGVEVKVLPVLLEGKKNKDIIAAQLQVQVSNPDFSQTVTVGGASVPSLITRGIDTVVQVRSGDTLVLGGLKRSERSVSKTRVPFLGRIPLLGLLFTQTDVIETTSSLFLFVTFEKVQ